MITLGFIKVSARIPIRLQALLDETVWRMKLMQQTPLKF